MFIQASAFVQLDFYSKQAEKCLLKLCLHQFIITAPHIIYRCWTFAVWVRNPLYILPAPELACSIFFLCFSCSPLLLFFGIIVYINLHATLCQVLTFVGVFFLFFCFCYWLRCQSFDALSLFMSSGIRFFQPWYQNEYKIADLNHTLIKQLVR